MTHFFNQNYLEKIKNDPVMNAVFNRDQKMQHFPSSRFHDYDAKNDEYHYDGTYDRVIHEPVRNPSQMIDFDEAATRRLELPERYRVGNIVQYTHVNRDLYWINMLPQNLYDINHVNKPNPIIGQLKTLPIHISHFNQNSF